MYVIDCGMRQSTIYNSETDTTEVISHLSILELPSKLPSGSKIVSEYAHLGCERKERSLAQVFTADQLLKFYDDCKKNNIELKLFPHQSTSRACNYSRLEKSDLNDPKSIYILLRDFPNISLMNPPSSFELTKDREKSYDWVDDSNMYLNIARRYQYLSDEDANTKFIKENADKIYNLISEDTRTAFGFELYKKKGTVNLNKLKIPQIYSILVQLQTPSGELRTRKRGKLSGWKWVKRYALKMTPFHLKGGVARSNIYYHGSRFWVASNIANEVGVKPKEIKKKRRGGYTNDEGEYIEPFNQKENELFVKYRARYSKAIKELFIVMKKLLET